jgi:hypothetical protein
MEMKKKLLLMGLASVLLMAGMMFAACAGDGGDDDDDGDIVLTVPKPEELPELPSGANVVYVSNDDEAKALLNSFKDAFEPVGWQVDALIRGRTTETENGRRWEIIDYTDSSSSALAHLKINSKGDSGEKTNMRYDDENYIPKKGDYMEEYSYRKTAIEFTDKKTEAEVTVYGGSKIEFEDSYSYRMTIKAINLATETGTATVSVNSSMAYAYGLTASYGGKGGRIILDVNVRTKLNKDVSSFDDDFDSEPATYEGSLKVYGESNEPVYTELINSEDAFDKVSDYFGDI